MTNSLTLDETLSRPEASALARIAGGRTFAHVPPVDAMVETLTTVLESATADQWIAGLTWYPRFAQVAEGLATAHGVRFDQAAGVLAILSPRTDVVSSVIAADDLLHVFVTEGEDAARSLSGHTVLPECVGWAVDHLVGDGHSLAMDDGKLSRSRKVRSFYRNIIGYQLPVTVDVWALRAVGSSAESLRDGAYVAVATAYRVVAERFDITPRAAQAVAWMAVRDEDTDELSELTDLFA